MICIKKIIKPKTSLLSITRYFFVHIQNYYNLLNNKEKIINHMCARDCFLMTLYCNNCIGKMVSFHDKNVPLLWYKAKATLLFP